MVNIFSKFLISLLALSVALTLVGCKRVTIENGRVPQEHLPKAQEYMGEYLGKFNGMPGKLILALNNDYVKASFVDGKGDDLLGAECESNVGDLAYLYFQGDDQNPTLTQATFKFDANKCRGQILGITLEIYFSDDRSNKNLGLSIIEKQTVRDVCTGPYPNNCHMEIETEYLRGQFTKTN
ncbi:MAG: hypothetical protein SGJ18_11250 [Pseudomonadota bacterium]|mgnify:CR=1 FL=1|nr:hypothetical protein [Pseudomonadota bacterium]